MSSEFSMSNDNSSNESWMLSDRERANQVINKYTGKTSAASTSNKRKSAPIAKDDDEYQKKRARNNVAVKKSREKAKNRIEETQVRVEQLSKENEDLQTKVNLLTKELNVLRTLFTNGGFTLPCDLPYVNNNSATPPEHHSPPPSMTYSPHSRISSEESGTSQPSPHHPYESEKSYHVIDDSKTLSKIPPLRPMPRIPSTSSSHSIHPLKSFQEKRMFFPSKNDYIQKDKVSGPPLLIQPQNISANVHLSQPHKGDTRHPSVIRSTTDVNASNTLGKFCIIQDTQGDKQIKIVPITS